MGTLKTILNSFITHLITAIMTALLAGHYLQLFKNELINHITIFIYFMVILLIALFVLVFTCLKQFLTIRNLTTYTSHPNGYLLDKKGCRYCPAHEKPVLLSPYYINSNDCYYYCPRKNCQKKQKRRHLALWFLTDRAIP
jgi:hypothetical protein